MQARRNKPPRAVERRDRHIGQNSIPSTTTTNVVRISRKNQWCGVGHAFPFAQNEQENQNENGRCHGHENYESARVSHPVDLSPADGERYLATR